MSSITAMVITALLVPTIFIAMLPRRWLVRSMLIWLVMPLIVYFAVIAYEIATRPPPPNLFENIAFGFMLVATIGAIPWLIVCVIGFGLGFLLRRIVHPGDRVAKIRDVEARE